MFDFRFRKCFGILVHTSDLKSYENSQFINNSYTRDLHYTATHKDKNFSFPISLSSMKDCY